MKLMYVALATGLLFAELPLAVAQLRDARFTEVEGTVQFQKPGRAPQAARLNATIQPADLVRTGQRSLAELEFNDKTLTRLGSNTVFSYNPENRRFQVEQGTALLQVPPKLGGAKIESGAVTAAITGTTVLVQRSTDGTMRLLVLEGRMNVTRQGSNQMRSLGPGQMLILPPNVTQLPQPVTVNVATILGTSRLIRGRRTLPSERDIERVVERQERLLDSEGYQTVGVVITTLDDLLGLTGTQTLNAATFDALTLEVFPYDSGELGPGPAVTLSAGSSLTLASGGQPGSLATPGGVFSSDPDSAVGGFTAFDFGSLTVTAFPTITNPDPSATVFFSVGSDTGLAPNQAAITFQNLVAAPTFKLDLDFIGFFAEEGAIVFNNSSFNITDTFFSASEGDIIVNPGNTFYVDGGGLGYLGAGRFLNIDGSTINVTGSSDLQLQAQFGVTITGSNIAPGVNPVNSVG
ncbi:MAG: FecR family protein, partial [Verrucomicrobiia bacterium]